MTFNDLFEPINLSVQHDDAEGGLDCLDHFNLDYDNSNAVVDDDSMNMDDSAHAIGTLFTEDVDNTNKLRLSQTNATELLDDTLLRDSNFSKFSVDSKLSTELERMFDEEEPTTDSGMVFDAACFDTNMPMMMEIGTKIVVPTKYDEVVLPEPEPIGVVLKQQHGARDVQTRHEQEDAVPSNYDEAKTTQVKTIFNHGYNAIRSSKSRRRRASQPEPYRPEIDEVKKTYGSPYNHEEYQDQVKQGLKNQTARQRKSHNDLDFLMEDDIISTNAGGNVPLGEIGPPQKHQRGPNGRRLQRRVTVDSSCAAPSLRDLFGGSSPHTVSTHGSTNHLYHRSGSYHSQDSSSTLQGILGTSATRSGSYQDSSFHEQDSTSLGMKRRGSYHEGTTLQDICTNSSGTATPENSFQYHEALVKLAESMKRTELSRRQLAWYPKPSSQANQVQAAQQSTNTKCCVTTLNSAALKLQQRMGSTTTGGMNTPSTPRSTSSDSLKALFGVDEPYISAATSTHQVSPIPSNNHSSTNLAAFFSGSRGTLTNGLEHSRRQLRMYADELKRAM